MNYVSSFYSTFTTLVDVSLGHVHASSYFSVARVRYTVLENIALTKDMENLVHPCLFLNYHL